MYLDMLCQTRKYYHRSDTHHQHPHSPPADSGPGITTQKSGTREIKVVRRVLDVNEKMADENRKVFAEKGVFVVGKKYLQAGDRLFCHSPNRGH